MKATFLSVAFLLATAPAFAQVPVLRCHEDVCEPVTQHVPVTPAVMEGLKARQFVYVPQSDGPTVTIIPDSSPEPAHYVVPPTYPLTNTSYPNTPFYPSIFPAFYPYPGFSEGVGSLYNQPVVVREIVREHDAPRVQPLPSAPPPAPVPAKDAPRGSLSLERLNSVR